MDKFIITAHNRLTGEREPISRIMTMEECQARLQLELKSRRNKSWLPYTRLAIERIQPVQLKLQFDYA